MATETSGQASRSIDLRRIGSVIDDFLVNLLLISIVVLALLFVVDFVQNFEGILIVGALTIALIIALIQNR